MQTRVKICARGYLDVLEGVETAQMTTCRGRGRVWSAMRVEGGAARRVQCTRVRRSREGLTIVKTEDVVVQVDH